MTLKLCCVSLALVAGLTSAQPEPKNLCPEGRVRFQGQVTFEDNQKPLQLSKDTVLTINVAEDIPSGAAPAAPITKHDVELSNYSLDKEITYGFCADLSNVSAKKVSLKAHIVDQAENDKLEYIGETVVTSGNDAYEADITLAKLDSAGANSEPSVADCQFGRMSEDVMGVAVRAAVRLNAKGPLPKPTFLAVTLNETTPDSAEPEPISLFAGDISNLYEAGRPLPAFLCAKVPITDDPVSYTLDATVHMGWDGFASPDAEDRTPRRGDYVISRETPVVFTQGQSDYSVTLDVKPYA